MNIIYLENPESLNNYFQLDLNQKTEYITEFLTLLYEEEYGEEPPSEYTITNLLIFLDENYKWYTTNTEDYKMCQLLFDSIKIIKQALIDFNNDIASE